MYEPIRIVYYSPQRVIIFYVENFEEGENINESMSEMSDSNDSSSESAFYSSSYHRFHRFERVGNEITTNYEITKEHLEKEHECVSSGFDLFYSILVFLSKQPQQSYQFIRIYGALDLKYSFENIKPDNFDRILKVIKGLVSIKR